ncbi:MAG: hypothetical protein M0P13_03010 [Fibrobacteraceae bacterium]|nr:hypothetical protein [Fibrobacteraceae bacterium]
MRPRSGWTSSWIFPGSKFPLGGDSKDPDTYPAYDRVEKEWRHRDFFSA